MVLQVKLCICSPYYNHMCLQKWRSCWKICNKNPALSAEIKFGFVRLHKAEKVRTWRRSWGWDQARLRGLTLAISKPVHSQYSCTISDFSFRSLTILVITCLYKSLPECIDRLPHLYEFSHLNPKWPSCNTLKSKAVPSLRRYASGKTGTNSCLEHE